VLGFVIDVARSSLFFVGLVCVLAAAEMAWPRGTLPTLADRLRAIQFGLVYILFAKLAGELSHLQQPVLSFPLAAVAVVMIDFLYYWFHRAQHAIPFLWRFHAVHHSIEALGAGKGYHHISEAPLKAVLVAAPVALLLGYPPLLVALALSVHGNYIHSATGLNFGRFAWAIADNRTHRIHHSVEPRHFNRNFGGYTMLWDFLFGTACFPRRGEWPNVGLAGHPEPRSIASYLVQPLRQKLGDIEVTDNIVRDG
jgi:sterol desaturase/sphingolipid hydroxylase (fatty acid hydroxylase superfamily)